MPLSFDQLKTAVRERVFPAGESRNLRKAHDKSIVDALVDIQRWVECLQSGNTHLVPHCATFYNCGITSFDFPRAMVKRLSVIEKASSTPAVADVPTSGGVAIGTEIGAKTVELAIYAAAAEDEEIADITVDGNYVIAVKHESPYCAYYPNNSPQYVRTLVTYTDTDGNEQTIKVAGDLFVNLCQNQSQLTVPIKAGTTVYATVTPVNEPFTDGMVKSTITVTAAGAANTENPSSGSVNQAADDWCSEIFYEQINHCHIRNFIRQSSSCSYCLPISQYFALPEPLCRGKSTAPVPTDEGVPGGLPALQLGYHYPQKSTDAACRARKGYWAIEGARIYIVPWIQSTETVVLRWQGIKRDWVDADLVDDDPELVKAVEEYLRHEHYLHWDKRPDMAQAALAAYRLALQNLIYDCDQETRLRACEPMRGRGIASLVNLFYNDQQQATETCPANKTGQPVTVTVPAESVASTVSKADANQKALEQARSLARAQLDCGGSATVYTNTAQSYTARCEPDPDAPAGTPDPEGSDVTVTIPAGTYESTVSQEDANDIALQAAQAQAEAQLQCTYWNAPQSYTAECPDASDTQTRTIGAHTYSSQLSQADADQKAYEEAKKQAIEALNCTAPPTIYYSTQQTFQGFFTMTRPRPTGPYVPPTYQTTCNYTLRVVAPAGWKTSLVSQKDANDQAYAAAQAGAPAINLLLQAKWRAGWITCPTAHAQTLGLPV